MEISDFFKPTPAKEPEPQAEKEEPKEQKIKKPKGYPKGVPHKMTFRNPKLKREAYTKYNRWKERPNDNPA